MVPFCSAHGFHHFFTEFHRWREWFRISTEYKCEINVEKTAIICKEEVVQVSTFQKQAINQDLITRHVYIKQDFLNTAPSKCTCLQCQVYT